MLFQYSHPAGIDAKRATLQERPQGFSASLSEEIQREPTPFVWTKGPEHFQRIIETTEEYQANHPKQPKAKADARKNGSEQEFDGLQAEMAFLVRAISVHSAVCETAN